MTSWQDRAMRGLRWASLAGVACAILGFPGAHAASRASVLQPLRIEAQRGAAALRPPWQAQQRHLPAFLHDTRRNPELLRRGLLTGPRLRRLRAAKPGARGGDAVASADSVCRVLLVRVGFSTNRQPALTSMDASGDFMLQPDSSVVVDPPPHDARYFEAQLLALQSFYTLQSRGRFRVDATVFPPQGEPSIKLGDVADYGPGAGGFWTLELLETYFRDAVALLDREAAGRLDLSTFDAIIIAHPGSDLQNDIRRNSPNDLPTFFITLGDSIPVMGGQHEIRNGLVLPETLSQDGALGSIQGALCHEFGHQLGLVDWYDTFSGITVVGEWALMDSGNAAFFAFQVAGSSEPVFALGLLPTGLSAYSRWLLGWEDPYVARAPSDAVDLRPLASELTADPTSVLLPVSPDEFFLVENRRDYLLQRPDLGETEPCPYLNRDPDTGVILWMSKDDPAVPARQRRNSGEYDFFIASPTAPEEAFGDCGELGFGLLVWHVDERKLLEGYAGNTVNVDDDYRAFRLVEASGDYEIGDVQQPTASFIGDGWNDPFRRDDFVAYTRLGPTTVPNNWNSDWAHSGWEITDVVRSGAETHTLHIAVRDGVAGWPRTFRDAAGGRVAVDPRSARVVDIAGRGRMVVAADSLGIVGVDAAGALELVPGSLRPATLVSHAAWGTGDAEPTLAALDAQGVRAWRARWIPNRLPERAGFPLALPGGSGTRLLLAEGGRGVAENAAGDWIVFDDTGAILNRVAGPGSTEADPVVGVFAPGGPLELALVDGTAVEFVDLGAAFGPVRYPLDWSGIDPGDLHVVGGHFVPERASAQVIVVHRDGRVRVIDRVDGRLPGIPDLPADTYTGVALADVDGDGWADLLATSATRLVGMLGTGARLLHTPLRVRDTFALRSAVHVSGEPILADVAGDSLPEIAFVTDLGLLYVLDATGKPLAGYPRKVAPDSLPAGVLAADLDADGATAEIVAVSPTEAVVLAPAGGSLVPGWRMAGGDAGRTRYAPARQPTSDSSRLRNLERPFLAYPNPATADRVHLRILPRSSGPYDIRIFNLEGEQVFERRGQVRAGAPVEIDWDVSRLASGVYVCRFVSRAAGVSSPWIEPITIVR